MGLEVIRTLMLAVQQPSVSTVTVRVNDEVASFLNNQKRKELSELEEEGSMVIKILGRENVFPEHLELDCRDEKGNEINLPR